MNDATALMTRYLLGELSEREQAELEARYFEDARVFEELAQVESALVDDYVRGRLAPEIRRQFETHFMADPRRRERVQFAEALARTIDRTPAGTDAQPARRDAAPGWGWRDWFQTPRFAMAFATALALVAVGGWLVIDARRTRQETAATPGVDEGQRAGEPSAAPPPGVEARPSPPPPADPTPRPAPTPRPVLAVATLALVVGAGERSSGTSDPPTLTIPPGTDQVRFLLNLREHDYTRYRVLVRVISGPEVLRQSDLVPAAAGAQPAFTLTAPVVGFEPGDYMLTLQGATTGGEYEDLSQTIFRIARQP